MEVYTTIVNVEMFNSLILWVVYIILPAFVGSYASDYFKSLNQEALRLSMKRILLATVIAVIITKLFLEGMIDAQRRAMLPFICLVLGLLGFELLHGMSSLENMIGLIKQLSKLIVPLIVLAREINEVRGLLVTQKDHDTRQKPRENEAREDT